VLLPLLILVMVGITGARASAIASRQIDRRGWAIALGAFTAVGILGPVASLLIFRDSPDRFVLVATILVALVPLAALAYTLLRVSGGGLPRGTSRDSS
jgi:hypothetical protein